MTSFAFIMGVLPLAIHRRRRQQPARHRHRRDGRHDHRHRAGGVPGPGVLRGGAPLFPASGGAPHGTSISAPLPVPHTPSRVPAAPAHPGDPA
jgi:hypothetical protein